MTGRSVLVVEDDYYLVGDTAAALRDAGATVLDPCPNEDATLNLLETETPSHAVLDLNLGGGGPRFEIAHALKGGGVPFHLPDRKRFERRSARPSRCGPTAKAGDL